MKPDEWSLKLDRIEVAINRLFVIQNNKADHVAEPGWCEKSALCCIEGEDAQHVPRTSGNVSEYTTEFNGVHDCPELCTRVSLEVRSRQSQ